MIPVAGADTAEELSAGYVALGHANVAAHLFGSRGWLMTVRSDQLEKARSILSRDVGMRPLLMTDEEIETYKRERIPSD